MYTSDVKCYRFCPNSDWVVAASTLGSYELFASSDVNSVQVLSLRYDFINFAATDTNVTLQNCDAL